MPGIFQLFVPFISGFAGKMEGPPVPPTIIIVLCRWLTFVENQWPLHKNGLRGAVKTLNDIRR